MRNDSGRIARSPRAGRSSGFSLRSILRNVSASASNLASTVRSAGSSVASTISSVEEERQREQVLWAGFDKLELGPANIRHVLLLTYLNGFQVWDVEEADDVWELVSKRDGPVAFLRVQPQPFTGASGGLNGARPLLLVVTDSGPANSTRSPGVPVGLSNGYVGVGSPPSVGGNLFMPNVVKFYSLRNHTYVHTMRFRSAIYAIRCSPRIVVVALQSQLYCFNAATLDSTFSVLTYPSPQASNGLTLGYGAVAVGPRWLAYAANHPLVSNTGRVSPQHLTPSPGVSPSTSPANGSLVAHYAKESSKQIVAGIVTLGDKGYKTFSRYCSEFFPEGSGSTVMGSPGRKSSCNGLPETDHAGIVIVRDYVTKAVVSQFRAHGSPLSALCFDPTGTLLVTASIHGHSINVFRILPQSNGSVSSGAYDANSSHVHLYKLNRGYTTGVIQDIVLSEDSHWIVVSTSKGTNHLFAISPFGGPVGPHTHGSVPVDGGAATITSVPLVPWWSNLGPVKSSQQGFSPPPPTVNLSIVNRIKYGQGGWRETVSGAAAAASGRACGLSGAVAVLFHDGKAKKIDLDLDQASLKELGQNSPKQHLWILFPSGHLIRYGLHMPSWTEESVSGVMPGHSIPDALEMKVAVEPLQMWDVCRRPNRVEREEKMENAGGHDEESTIRCANNASGANGRFCMENGVVGKEGLTAEELHQLFLSNAEVQMHHFKPPFWAKSQVSFHVFTGAETTGLNGECDKSDFCGEVEIEKVQTRVVEIRKKDLVPVFDRLKNLHCGEGIRNLPLNGTNFHSQLLGDDGNQYGSVGPDVYGAHIHRSSSGSSCGSEGSTYSGANAIPNGFHQSYQDPCQFMQIGFVNDAHTSVHSHPQQSYPHLERAKLQSTLDAKKHVRSALLIGSPPMDIPRLSDQDYFERAPPLGQKQGASVSVGIEDPQKGATPAENGVGGSHLEKLVYDRGAPFSCEKPLDRNGSSYTASQDGLISGSAVSNKDDQDALVALRKSGSSPCSSGSNKDSGTAFDGMMIHVEKLHLPDYDGVLEDADSTDATNSKSEDFGGDQAEDGWEGTMFPFAEDE